MSISVSPVSAMFATPPVAETHTVSDREREHAQDGANARRQSHPQPALAATQHPASPVTEPDACPTLGRLIDVRV